MIKLEVHAGCMDQYGQVKIPAELWEKFDLEPGCSVDFFKDPLTNSIGIKRYRPMCVLCGEINEIITVNGKGICPKCLSLLKNI